MHKWDKKIVSDTADIHILEFAANEIKNVEGLILEIGTRLGGGIQKIMETCINNNDTERFFLGIDPYGDILYKHGEFGQGPKSLIERCSFNTNMMSAFLSEIYNFCYENNLYFQHFLLEDSEFFRIYNDGVIIYSDDKHIINKYALVHIDGPHNFDSVLSATNFFLKRLNLGGVLVYDDYPDYDHNTIHDILLKNSFRQITYNSARKIAYKKY